MLFRTSGMRTSIFEKGSAVRGRGGTRPRRQRTMATDHKTETQYPAEKAVRLRRLRFTVDRPFNPRVFLNQNC